MSNKIRIIQSNNEREMKNTEGFEGIFKKFDCLNNYVYTNGKSQYSVQKVVIYNDKEDNEEIGSFRWITGMYGSNNATIGLEIPELKKVRTLDVDKNKEKGISFVIPVKSEYGNNREKECIVYLPLSKLKGEIITEERIWDKKLYATVYYCEDKTKTSIKVYAKEDLFDAEEEIEKLMKKIENLKGSGLKREELRKEIDKMVRDI